MSAPLWLFIWVMFLAFAWYRLRLYLHFFQQQEYDAPRFLKWIVTSGSYDRRVSIFIALLAVLAEFLPRLQVGWVASAIVAGLLLSTAWRERKPLPNVKKRLVMTPRAKRIYAIAFVYAAGIGLAFSFLYLSPLWWIIPIQLMPLTLALAVLSLAPQESLVQRKYWREAHEKLARLEPKVIGITGSFGKTSSKHILFHVLENTSSGLATPGSVNTPMGIARIMREQLRPEHRYFIAEMGAYGPGSIDRICQLAPPDLAIITAVGKAHYERFKTLDTVATAKFELAKATVTRGGKVIVTEDVLSFAPARAFADRHTDAIIVCGRGKDADLRIIDNAQTKNGLSISIEWRGEHHELSIPLFGLHNVENIALVFAAACTYGADPETVSLALKSTPQITHRLEVKVGHNEAVLIDNAYNSNPKGFTSALETLDLLVGENGRRIVVTPGMVELGAAHDEEHARLGTITASYADIVLAIQPERIKAFVSAYQETAGAEKELHTFPGFAEADLWLQENAKLSDVVLLENDLPDLYEQKLPI
jgi:UDP-N-acetylmuramoyl-tripeptide--D-alanyl-D-alanine ligase